MPIRYFIFLFIFCSFFKVFAQKDTTALVEGWSFGALPAIAYNADFGLLYGALANIYYYGDGGSRYPYYDHSIYLEATNTTNGERKLQMRYDARQLVKEGRFRVRLIQLLNLYRPFYGFNGYASYFDQDQLERDDPAFISPLYYSFEQNWVRASVNIEKNLKGKQLRVQGGLMFQHFDISPTNISRFNEGKSESRLAPDTLSLYDNYVQWGVISADEKSGGTYLNFSFGGVIDTRDIEPWPGRGLWEEATFNFGLPIDGVSSQVISIDLIHRHYQTIFEDRLVFAHRLLYQTYLNDDVPFYLLQILGGNDNLRGIRFARLAGLGVAAANAELRWKVFKWVIFNQNIYGGMNIFFDTGVVTRPYAFDDSGVPANYDYLIQNESESFHHAVGVGLKGALNENFIISVDYGRALDPRDGERGVYIGLDWLF